MAVQTDIKNSVFVLRFDNPNSKGNFLTYDIVQVLLDTIDHVSRQPDIKGLVVTTAKPDSFLCGFDLNKFAEWVDDGEENAYGSAKVLALHHVIENVKKPIVFAISGECTSAGLELALAAQYRIAVNSRNTVFSSVDIQMGMVCMLGGSQRLPRTVSLLAAMNMLLGCKRVPAPEAKRIGLVDHLIEPVVFGGLLDIEKTLELLENSAISATIGLSTGNLVACRQAALFDRGVNYLMSIKLVQDKIWSKSEDLIQAKTLGTYPAVRKMLQLVKETYGLDTKKGYKVEQQFREELMRGDEVRAFLGILAAMDKCRGNCYPVPNKKINSLAILGASALGLNWVRDGLTNGFYVILQDYDSHTINDALIQIKQNALDDIPDSHQREHSLSKFETTCTFDEFWNADVILETSDRLQDLNSRRKPMADCDGCITDQCVYAVCNSIFRITDVAAASRRPEMVVGINWMMHSENVYANKLVEVVVGENTSQDTAGIAVELGLQLGKAVIVVQDRAGFYLFRMSMTLVSEMVRMLREGLSPERLDDDCRKAGFSYGLATWMDELGFEFIASALDYLTVEFGPRFAQDGDLNMIKDMLENGILGRSSGRGCILYQNVCLRSRPRGVNVEAIKLFAKHFLPSMHDIHFDDLRNRLLVRLTNEAVMCLQEGVIASPLDGDIGAVYGLGFPQTLGGPFRWLDITGAANIVNILKRYEVVYGSAFAPSQLLLDHANSPERRFHQKMCFTNQGNHVTPLDFTAITE